MSGVLAALKIATEQRCGLTVAVAVADTWPLPEVPVAVAVFVTEAVIVIERGAVRIWFAPGASGPQLPTVKSSPGFPGVPASSFSVPDAVKKSPVFVTLYPKVTGVLVPAHTSAGEAAFWSEIVHLCPFTV